MFDITQHKTPDGAWRCSTIFNGRLVTRVYFGYAKRESERLFRVFISTIKD